MIARHVLKACAVMLSLMATTRHMYAQLVIEPNADPATIAQSLVGEGVQIFNINVNAAGNAYGFYTSNATEIGSGEGLILSTGDVVNAYGPNNSSGLPQLDGGNCLNCDFFDNNWPGSDLLDLAQDRETFDAALFEFDVIPQGDSLKFEFTFASEEYLEWVDSPFNDVFGFFISGPNIGVDVNIAIVPGTNDPVAINSVNPGQNSQYFYNNVIPPGQNVQYDGLILGLTARVGDLIPCQTYHLKLIIADGSDRLYDSAVFVEKIESNPVTVTTITQGGTDYMVEGCNDGSIIFEREEATEDEQVITFWIGGTATDGVDYLPAIGTGNPEDPITIVIPANESSVNIDLEAVLDGVVEENEYITIYLANPSCNNGFQDSVNFFIQDFLTVNAEPEFSEICQGQCVQLSSAPLTDGNASFSWSPVEGLSNPLDANPLACPQQSTVYTITSQLADCIATDEVQIDVNTLNALLATTPTNCAGGPYGSIDLSLTEGVAPFAYEWSGPDGFTFEGEDPQGLVPGEYCVTVTDAEGCTGSFCATIAEENTLEIGNVIFSDFQCFPISCYGVCDGSITIVPQGGLPPYNYQWDDPAMQTGQTAAGLCAGTYSVGVTDSQGCEFSADYTLQQPEPLEVELLGTVDVLCSGEQTGAANVNSTGGCAPYFYIWSHDPILNTPVANNLPSGIFEVSVSDSNGCISEDAVTIEIGEPGAPLTANFNIPVYPNGFNVSCAENSDGSIGTTISGGTPGYNILWFTNGLSIGATEDLTNLPCGTYTIQITDANNCVFTQTISLTCPQEIDIDWVSIPNPCIDPEAGLGAIDITVSNGFPPYSYDWSGPNGYSSSIEDISGLNSGTYTVVVTDFYGCTQAQNSIVGTSQEIQLSASVTNETCFGECNGAIDLFISGGISDLTFVWTDENGNVVSNLEDPSGLCAGEYQVVATDLNNCEQVAVFEVFPAIPLEITIDEIISPFCSGLNDGSISTSISGGTGMVSVEWLPNPDASFTGSTDDDISNLFGGTYTIIATDETGCSVSQTVPLIAPEVMNIFVSTSIFNGGLNISCPGAGDGQISVSVSGGTPDCIQFAPNCYQYDWGLSPIGANDPSSPFLSNLDGGNYLVVATDANGCIAATTISLLEPEVISIQANVNPVSCPGSSDGTITPLITGGNGIFVSFDWSQGASIGANAPDAPVLTSLEAGTYVLEVTDSNGCMGAGTFVVEENQTLSIALNDLSSPACPGDSDGFISISASGGDGNYMYEWEGPSCPCIGNVITDLEAGTYTVTATDGQGCSSTQNFVLPEPPSFSINLLTQQNGCEGNSSGTITTLIQGGTPGFSFEWTLNGNFFSDSQNIDNLEPGIYCITSTDANGCEAVSCAEITSPADPLVVTGEVTLLANGFNISCFGLCDGLIDLTVSGGTPGYSFLWRDELDNEIYFGEDLTNACAGDYEVLVQDNAGCFQTLFFSLTEPTELQVEAVADIIIAPWNVSCPGAMDGSISASANGGIPNYDFQWSGNINANGQEISGLSGGSYTLTVTDATGCVAETTINLLEPQPITFDAAITPAGCPGNNIGAIDANISGGTGNYISIVWDNAPDGNELIENLSPGSYTITVTDSNGCESEETFILSEPELIALDAIVTDSECGEANGSIDLMVIGGVAPYSFAWTGPTPIFAGTEDPNNLSEGSYTILVTDGRGCEASLEVFVDGNPGVSLQAVSTNIDCFGNNTGAIDLTIIGGSGPFAIEWLDGNGVLIATEEDIAGLEVGTFFATITDANGCNAGGAWQIGQPSAINVEILAFEFSNGFNISTNSGNDGAIDTQVEGGSPEYTYEWSGPVSIDDNTEDPQGLPAGTYLLTVTDANGCAVDTSITLDQPLPLELPTGLSPNGDGLNDTFVILGIEDHLQNTFKVFNRWGNLVYNKPNYYNEWGGTSNDGEDLPDGTYFVLFESSKGLKFNTYVDLRR